MRYRATVGDYTFVLGIADDTGSLRVTVDGVHQEIDLHSVDGKRLYSLMLGSRSYEVLVERVGDVYLVDVDGHAFEVSLQDERKMRLDRGTVEVQGQEGEVEIRAPMPGLVMLVNVKPGDQVRVGKALVVLQAMKMENDLSSPRDGVVKDVRVAPGGKVDKGQVLVTIG